MPSKKTGAIVAGALLALVIAVGVVAYRVLGTTSATSTSASTASVPAEQQSAPMLADYDATVYTSEGESVRLTELANGKPLVLNFWATWCPYCVQEMPDYQQLFHIYGDRIAFAFIDCNYSRSETVEKALGWLSQNGFSDLPTYFDTYKDASTALGAWSYPTSVVIDAKGEIVSAAPGKIDPGRMDALLASLVA